MYLPHSWKPSLLHYLHFHGGGSASQGQIKQRKRKNSRRNHRLDFAVEWLRKLGVRKLRTCISWADWCRPNALPWFDRQMAALAEFDTTITLCFTPLSRGQTANCTNPPVNLEEFTWFAREVATRYVLNQPMASPVHAAASAGTK